MKHTPIHSKWHKIADPFKCNVALEVDDYHGFDQEGRGTTEYIDQKLLIDMFRLFDILPKYVMYDDIVDLVRVNEGPIAKNVKALVQAGLAHLPHSEMLIEFDVVKTVDGNLDGKKHDLKVKAREFVWIGEKPDRHFENAVGFPFFAQPMTVVDIPGRSAPMIILNPVCVVGKFDELVDDADNKLKLGMQYKSYLSPFIRRDTPQHHKVGLMDASTPNCLWSSTCALTAAISLLRTKGIVQDRIEAPAKLNKSRAASGKPLIRDHTVIRIGHVYDRAGKAVNYTPTGRKMPVHWRAGHIRNQRFGKGLEKSYEVFIEPMLINYEEGDKVPAPVKEVTV